MLESNKCEVKGCSGDALHQLPGDLEKRRLWTDALNFQEVDYAPSTQVMCTEHFQMLDGIDVTSIIVTSSKGSSTASGSSYDENDKMNATPGLGSQKATAGNISAPSNTSRLSSYDEDDFSVKSVQIKGKVLLSRKATTYLKSWLSQHIQHPYPSEKEKAEIAAETDLTSKQVSNWFINARRRLLKPLIGLPNGISASSSTSADVDGKALSPQQCGYKPRRRSLPKAQTQKEMYMSKVTPLTTTRTTSSCPSMFDRSAPISPLQQGGTEAKRPRKRPLAQANIDLIDTPSTNVSSPASPDSTSALTNGVENKNVRKSSKKDLKKSIVIRKPKSSGKNILKVVFPAVNFGRVKSRKRPKTITSTIHDSQLQSTTSKNPTNQSPPTCTPPINTTKLANRPKPVSVLAAVVARPALLPHAATQCGVSNGTSSGEDLLDSLYEELYLKSESKGVEVGSVEKLELLGREQASTSRTTETQTCYNLSHRETQTSVDLYTSSNVHSAALSFKMYQNRPDWVKYHTGLLNYEQFKLVLDSLGLGVYYLADRYSTPDKPLCVEDQLLMTLMKLRRAEPDLGIGIVFGVPKKTVEDIIKTWTNVMYRRWSLPDVWTTKELTAWKVCRPNGTPNTGNPLLDGEKPFDPAALERVRQLYKILNVNLTLHKPFSDNVLFVCCTLYDFRGGIITTRKP